MKDHATISLNISRPELSPMSSCVQIDLVRHGERVEVRAVDPITRRILSRFSLPASLFREFVA